MALKTVFRLSIPLLCALAFVTSTFAGEDFKPVSPAELSLKDNPAAPGEHAMILEMSDVQDDNRGEEEFYYRIKIFTEQGKKHADVEIPYFKDYSNVKDIKARTIQPDGSIVPFDGKVYDKMIAKARGVKFQAKTFSMPAVQPGSVIEYRYKFTWPSGYLTRTRWVLQKELFVKKGYFKLVPASNSWFGSAWQSINLPKGVEVKKGKNGILELEMHDMPAFDGEHYAPPENQLKPRVDFFYRRDESKTADEFWENIAKERTEFAEDFIGKGKNVAGLIPTIVAPTDTDEVKVQKLYAKVASLRNTDYDREKTQQEVKRDKTKYNNKVEDVFKRGYGETYDLNALMVAMARAAGYESYLAFVSERDDTFFNKNIVDSRQMDATAAYVKAGGKEYWLDPGTPFTPFGMLPWRKTGVASLLLSDKKKAVFVNTPNVQSRDAITRRIAKLAFQDGLFKGEVALGFSGQEALYRRLNAKREDEQSVKEDLEKELKQTLPGGSTVKIKRLENLNDISKLLLAFFDVEVPNPPSSAGSRMLLPTSIFEHGETPFQHEQRRNWVYFAYPFQVIDDITLTMPSELKVEAVPDKKHEESDFGYFDATWTGKDNVIQMKRGFAVHGIMYPVAKYPEIRSFYSKVASSDQENVILRASQVSSR